MSAGIDYGMGRPNINHATGIRYGVISQHSVMLEYSDLAYDYGEPTCPKCGGSVVDAAKVDCEDWPQYERGCSDYACESCEHILDSSDVYGEEANGWSYSGDGYKLTSCLDSDVFVLASPYYTLAQFCSPCVPGAGNLDSADEDGVKTYCLGHDWFEERKAPYKVYSVATGEEVKPEQ